MDIGTVEQARLGIYPARPAGLLADGTVYGVTPAFSNAVVEGTLTSLAHVRMDSEGRTVDTLVTSSIGPTSVLGILRDDGGVFTSQPFGDEDVTLLEYGRGGLLMLERKAAANGGQQEFRLTRVDLLGDTVFSRSYPYEPVAIPTDTIDKSVESIADGLYDFVGEQMGASRQQWRGLVREAMYIPDYYTPINTMVAGRDGTIWLARSPAGAATVEWIILDASGEPVGRTETPVGFRLLLADESTLWGVHRDDLEVEYIVRYSRAAEMN